MLLRSVRVKNYRAIADQTISLEPYTALVGANGSGKSTVIHALNWFFNGERSDEFDFHIDDAGVTATEFSVTVTFSGLSANELMVWSKYVRGDELQLQRVLGPNGDKLSGRSLQGPGFSDVWQAPDAPTRVSLYAALRAVVTSLPAARSKDAIEAALEAWESDVVNAPHLIDIPSADLGHAFGFNGKNLLADVITFVLVPASTRLEANVDPSERGGAIERLLGAVVRQAADSEVTQWTTTNGSALTSLGVAIDHAVTTASQAQVDSTNHFLGELIVGAKVSLNTVTLPPKIQPQIDVSASLEFEGPKMPISKQGHGVQRSVMMSTLQAAASIGPGLGKTIVLAIEEPELYQHPTRSMALAKALVKLADSGDWQAIIATHSPSFLGTEAAVALRRFRREAGAVKLIEGSAAAFATKAQKPEAPILPHLEQLLPGDFANAYFADRVLLVEGITDKIIVGRVCDLLGLEVDANNFAIVDCQGKGNLHIAASILESLMVEARVLFDADFKPPAGDSDHKKQTQVITKNLRESGFLGASDTFAFGDESVVFDKVGILHRDIEEETENWPSYLAVIQAETGGNRCKNPYIVRKAAAAGQLSDCPPTLLAIAELLRK